MGLRVNTNLEAMNIHRNLINTNDKVATSLKRLSSGFRVMSAKDDAAGYAVANSFKAKVSSLRVAYQNASESNSMLQTADGAYSKMQDIMIRMKDLATQAAGGQLTNENRTLLNTEFKQLTAELDRIAESTKYNGVTLVFSTGTGGNAASFTFQIGTQNVATDQLSVSLKAVSSNALGISASAIGTAASAGAAMTALDTALTSINNHMAEVGAFQNRLAYTMDNLNVQIENFSASESAIRDVDMAYEVTQFTKNQILQQSGMAMLSQANQAPQQILQLLGG
jgi:flagellin